MVNQRKLLKQGFVPGSFHRQLTVVSSVGLLALALAISLVSSGFRWSPAACWLGDWKGWR